MPETTLTFQDQITTLFIKIYFRSVSIMSIVTEGNNSVARGAAYATGTLPKHINLRFKKVFPETNPFQKCIKKEYYKNS